VTPKTSNPSPGANDPERWLREAIASTAERTRGRIASGHGDRDGDEVVGTFASDEANGFDPMPVLRALSDVGAPAVVIGQVAGILHGSVELTGDLDLLWSGDARDVPAMRAAFGALSAAMTDDDGAPVALERAFGLPKALFRTPSAAGDCCTPRLPWKGLNVESFIERAERAEIDGAVVRYVGISDLIEMRIAADRPKDRRRAAELRELLRRHERS
jgi:hypothetical protein